MPFIYNILPEYTQSLDTLVDRNNRGEVKLLSEYTEVIDETIFDVLSASIREISTFSDIYAINEKYIRLFSYLLGYKWNDYLPYEIQRDIVANILQLYKRKGIRFSFHFSLYQLDPNVEIYEPYKDIFVLNKSRLSSDKHLPSQDYYCVGIIVIRINNLIPEIFEIFESVRPAGWRIILEGKSGLFYNLHIKPYTQMREYYSRDRYKITDPTNEYQVQFWHSIQYVNDSRVILTMMGKTFFVDSLWTLTDIKDKTILEPNESLQYHNLWRYPNDYFEYRPHYMMKIRLPYPIIMMGKTLMNENLTPNSLKNFSIVEPNPDDLELNSWTLWRFNGQFSNDYKSKFKSLVNIGAITMMGQTFDFGGLHSNFTNKNLTNFRNLNEDILMDRIYNYGSSFDYEHTMEIEDIKISDWNGNYYFIQINDTDLILNSEITQFTENIEYPFEHSNQYITPEYSAINKLTLDDFKFFTISDPIDDYNKFALYRYSRQFSHYRTIPI